MSNLDHHLLAPHIWLLIQVDTNADVQLADVQRALGLRSPGVSCANLPFDLSADGYNLLHTPAGNPMLVRLQALALPAQLGGSLREAGSFRPAEYNGCHPQQRLEYSAATKWYAHGLLRLRAMDYFDFFIKIDIDVTLLRRQDPAAELVARDAWWLHTATFPAQVPAKCDGSLADATRAFLQPGAANCPSGLVPEQVLRRTPVFYSNYVAGWLGLFQSPQMLAYSEHWWGWPGGWRHRWGDQTFWSHALYVTNATKRVADLTVWRTEPASFVHKVEPPRGRPLATPRERESSRVRPLHQGGSAGDRERTLSGPRPSPRRHDGQSG